MDHSTTLATRIASLVHEHFDALPARSKPTIHPDGSREWIPMSGMVIVKGESTPLEKLTCVAVATGAKCLPASQISQCRGLVLHDCHAEILTIRAFNYWLLNECRDILSSPTGDKTSPYIRHCSRSKDSYNKCPPLELHPDIKIYMYCTCAPCGDASMELCMAAQEDPTPWELPPPAPSSSNNNDNETSLDAETDTLLVGRAHFSILGAVRRKPARMDAESTRSKSCSDKLALRQVSSLLSYETSLLVAPTENVYLEGIVLPEEEITRVGCERAFGATGRMKMLNSRKWPASGCPDNDNGDDENDQNYNYKFRPFQILSIPPGQIELLWPFRKPPPLTPSSTTTTTTTTTTNKKSKPSNLSVIWTLASSHTTPIIDHNPKSVPKLRGSTTGLYETIINGVKQGNKASNPLARGASALSRARLWALVRDIIVDQAQSQGDDESMRIVLEASTYDEFKDVCASQDIAGAVVARGQAIKDARQVLKGWVPNSGDGKWGLDVLVDPKKRKRDTK